MLNRVVLVGRLVADPEMKYTPAGVAVAQMRIAVNRVTKNEQGEYETDFFNVVAWRRTAEFAANYLTKGRLISVDGRLRTRSWVAQDGTKRNVVEIEADNVEGLDRRGDTANAAEGEAVAAAPPARAATPTAASVGSARNTAPPEDDLDEADPFADE
ncbi:MAG TPA: single-stranded DNA-binding protein [Chthonomonadaceae bacterium]|nr:single-stranded DNA-binding protein [Chthonomonadaceae bacterium]